MEIICSMEIIKIFTQEIHLNEIRPWKRECLERIIKKLVWIILIKRIRWLIIIMLMVNLIKEIDKMDIIMELTMIGILLRIIIII